MDTTKRTRLEESMARKREEDARSNDKQMVLKNLVSYSEFIRNMSDEDFDELRELLPVFENKGRVTLKKAEILVQLLHRIDSNDLSRVSVLLDKAEYGWHGNKYIINNRCLSNDKFGKCRTAYPLKDREDGERIFDVIDKLFFDSDCGSVTLCVFSYCLVALFSSMLNHDGIRAPYFLQIACRRNSVLYGLIQEIVEVCDVNAGIHEECDAFTREGDYYCEYMPAVIYPTQYTEDVLIDLVKRRDVPVIVDGHENEKYYSALLREIVNMPHKNSYIGLREKLNVLPIFVCDEIKSAFNNVLSMDLNELEVSAQYLYKFREEKAMLGSWVKELVLDYSRYLLPPKPVDAAQKKFPFFDDIRDYMTRIRGKHKELEFKSADNAALLNFFFRGYMNVLKPIIRFSHDERFEIGSHGDCVNVEGKIFSIGETARKSLARLHQLYVPAPIESLVVEIGGKGAKPSTAVEKKARRFAIHISRCYQSYGVALNIFKAEIKGARYIFGIRMLPGTRRNQIVRYAGDVQQILGYKYFYVDVMDSPMKIVVSERELKENSLAAMLESAIFRDSVAKIPYAIGYDVTGEMMVEDVAKFPHLVIGGASGFGKSSALHSLMMSVVCGRTASAVNILALDFGASGLDLFNRFPHMACDVITDGDKGYAAIIALKAELDRRKSLLEARSKEFDLLPSIVCVIDEFPTFIRHITAGRGNGQAFGVISDLVELGRKLKLHFVLATNDPTKNSMKSNISTIVSRIAFRCDSWRSSAAILGEGGAEGLINPGDMLFKTSGHVGFMSVKGAYIPMDELAKRIDTMTFADEPLSEYSFRINAPGAGVAAEAPDELTQIKYDHYERKLAEAILWALGRDTVSSNTIQKEFQIGNAKACEFIDVMERFGLVAPKRDKLARAVLPKSAEEVCAIGELVDLLDRTGFSSEDIENVYRRKG